MTITAVIQFTQDLNTDIPGNAVFGDLTSGPVVCTCVTTGDPNTFVWSLVDKPAASGLALGQFSPNVSGSFPEPDVRGGYLVELTASHGSDTVTTQLAFVVPEVSGRYIPPFKAADTALTFSGNNRGWSPCMEAWLKYLDTLTGGSPVVASVAALAALPSAGITDGTIASVKGLDTFMLDRSGPSDGYTTDGVNVISASGVSGGKWVRTYGILGRYQFFQTINVNQATGNDGSIDPENGTPLKTLAEAATRIRRLGLETRDITINYAATTSAESVDFDLNGVQAVGSSITITIIGSLTVSATQTASGYTAPDPTSNARGTLTFPAAGYAAGTMLLWNSAAVAWSIGLQSADVNFTGNFLQPTNSISNPGGGSSVSAVALASQIGNISARLPPGFKLIVQNVEVTGDQFTQVETAASCTFVQCKITNGRVGFGLCTYSNCLVGGLSGSGHPAKQPDGATFQNCTFSASLFIVGCQKIRFVGSNVGYSPATLGAVDSTVLFDSDSNGLEDIGFFGLSSTASVFDLTNTFMNLGFAVVWGANPGGVNQTFLLHPGAWVFYNSNTPPTATGPTSAWKAGGRTGTFAQLPVSFPEYPGGFVRSDEQSGSAGASVDLTAQVANIGTTSLFATNPRSGLYRVVGYLELTHVGTSGAVNLNATWTDRTGTVQTKVICTIPDITVAGAGVGGVLSISTNGTSQVSYSVTGITTPGSLTYALRVGVRPVG